jgi:hypothetical protein
MSTIIVEEFVQKYNNEKVYYDPSFQRRVVWDNNDLSKFVRSLTKGSAKLTTIIVVNVRDCLDFAVKNGDQESIVYYRDIHNRGFVYVSLDGQNRSRMLTEFINSSEQKKISGKFVDLLKDEVTIVNKKFSDFPRELKLGILKSQITVVEAGSLSRADLSENFDGLNSGVPLNEQEKRNAKPSSIAPTIRELSKKYRNALYRVTKERDRPRMADDKLLAHMLMALIPNNTKNKGLWNLSEPETDDFYNLGLDFVEIDEHGCPYTSAAIDRTVSIVEQWSHIIIDQTHYTGSKVVSKKMSWAVLLVCEWLYDSGMTIQPDKRNDFFKKLKRLDDELISDSDNQYLIDRQKAMKIGLDPDSVSKSSYYSFWTSCPHIAITRNNRKDALINKINTSSNKKSLNICKLRSKRELEVAAK